MGAANAIRAYATYGATLGDHALRALVYMALVSMDGDAEPWFGLGHDSLSELAFGRPVPDKDTDPAGHEAALRSVRRAVTDLQEAGAVRTSERARFGAQRAQNARYRLYLSGPCPEGEVPPARKWKRTPPDAERPMGADADRPMAPDARRPVDSEMDIQDVPVGSTQAPDADRPMAPDADRPADGETIGRFVTGHRTQNVQPPDAKRPTKEEEEEEERINDGPVGAATVEGAPLRVVENPAGRDRRRRGKPRMPGERPLIPAAVPDPDPAVAAEPEARPRYGPPCGTCDPSTRMLDRGNGTYTTCPRCHPYREAAS